ncbi:hypothetical protein MPTK1_7g01600 [Marchantia polymorpha subsp. ruderalis]|uniref:Uncharacterized protein n=2 Tax=Marchantia polymorpha TaxID=3197 RepID=A0AAF6BV35_MARPO|nr:hypothetical protein MARPO_0099s0033 [Marchantia polymorpha]BBN15869.1 hypothetical protein Mp_7g01600 [Marchantia polymorpha subsp. ruderalis]|eukprot:PTQ32397.1 hypothetical protein MARPO_0099s0033 [Marchantia polymorpha]
MKCRDRIELQRSCAKAREAEQRGVAKSGLRTGRNHVHQRKLR